MADIINLRDEVVARLKETEEYKNYRHMIDEIKKDPELYAKVQEIREKNYRIQMDGGSDALDRVDALTNEYEDVINIELVRLFLSAEADFCSMMQDFNEGINKGLEFD